MTPLPARKPAAPTPDGPREALLGRWIQVPEFGAFIKVTREEESDPEDPFPPSYRYKIHKAATTEDPLPGSGSRHQALEADYCGPVEAIDREFSDHIADLFGVRFPPNVDW